MNPDAYVYTRVRVRKIRMVRKIYAVFYLKYISNPFSLKIVYKVVFVSPDAYVYTQVWVREIRIVPKIYAVFYLKYISNPFSVDLAQGGFRKPRRVLRYASSVNKSRIVPKIYAVFYLKYISNPFSVKIWCKTGFRKPRRVLRYASSGEENSYRAEDLRRNCCFIYHTRLA